MTHEHPGNIVADGQRATLIDWGSCRVGPAALDLANMVPAGSADFARYARTWRRHTGRPLDGDAVKLGYRWAALDRIEQAMSELEAGRIGL